VLDLLYKAKIFSEKNLKQIYKSCIKNEIDTLDKYNKFIEKNEWLRLKKNIFDYKGFKWKPICEELGKKYYSSIEECQLSIEKIKSDNKNKLSKKDYKKFIQKFKRYSNIYLNNNFDEKIPPFYNLQNYY
jgi:hypothetical protein